MVNAYETPDKPPVSAHPPDLNVDELRRAVRAGDYNVSAQEIAEALLSWHLRLSQGRMPHKAAPFQAGR